MAAMVVMYFLFHLVCMPSVFATLSLQPGDRVHIFGDDSQPTGFVNLLEGELAHQNISVSKSTSLGLSIFDTNTLQNFFEDLQDISPNVCVVMLGRADLFPIQPQTSLHDAMERAVIRILALENKPSLVLAGPIIDGEQRQVDEYNILLERIALDYNIRFLDIHAPILKYLEYTNHENSPHVLTYDGRTLNRVGSAVVSRIFMGYFGATRMMLKRENNEILLHEGMSLNIDKWVLDCDRKYDEELRKRRDRATRLTAGLIGQTVLSTRDL